MTVARVLGPVRPEGRRGPVEKGPDTSGLHAEVTGPVEPHDGRVPVPDTGYTTVDGRGCDKVGELGCPDVPVPPMEDRVSVVVPVVGTEGVEERWKSVGGLVGRERDTVGRS